MKSTFKILFFLRKDKTNSEGYAPVHVRLTIDGCACQFSAKVSAPAAIWDAKGYRATGRSEEARKVNLFLDHLKKTLLNHYQSLSQLNDLVTPDMVRDKLLGKNVKENTLLGVFSDFIEQRRKLIGIDITQSTFNKYVLTSHRLEEFLLIHRKTKDIALRSVDHAFVVDFHTYLKTDCRLSINSSEKLMRIFKRITTVAFKTGVISRDPFAVYAIKKVKTKRGFLTEEELSRICNFETSSLRLQKVRDIFIFACFTGLDYSTLFSLTEENIVKKQSGIFILAPRVKTREVSQIKLLPQALEILEKYKDGRVGGRIIPLMSNAKYNLYLKEIAQQAGITKRVTSHLARHTFATTITYANGVSLGSIQKMLGHAKRSTTEIYAEMLDKTVEKEMDQLNEVLQAGNLPYLRKHA